MKIQSGLIIDEPWIGLILKGDKDWEMRSRATSFRGWFGLIRKGSGQVVGLAKLVDCGRALNPSEMIALHEHHRIPNSMIQSGMVSKWVVPWKLAEIRPLKSPIPYEHKSGAVTWVLFSEEVSTLLAEALAGTTTVDNTVSTLTRTIDTSLILKTSERTAADAPKKKRTPTAMARSFSEDAPGQLLGRSLITGGNLRNNHFYIGEFLDKFPADSVGGSNKQEAAPREITVDWGGPALITTDIDQTKRMFRKRGWVRHLFLASGASEGDAVVVTSSKPYHVHVRVERKTFA